MPKGNIVRRAACVRLRRGPTARLSGSAGLLRRGSPGREGRELAGVSPKSASRARAVATGGAALAGVAALVCALVLCGCGGGGGGGDDAFEPNDDFLFAYVLPPGVRLTDIDAAGGAVTTTDTVDFFRTDPGLLLASGDTLLVYCEFDKLQGDLDLRVYQPNQVSYADSADPAEDYDLMRYSVTIAGQHFIRVRPDVAADVAYDLWYQRVPADLSDPYEPNDARGASPTSYAMAEDYWLSDPASPNADHGWAVARKASDDEDWYELAVPGSGTVTVKVWCDFYHALGNVDMSLQELDGTELAASAGTTDGEYLQADVTAPTTVYVTVFVEAADAEAFNSYDLYWEAQ